MKIHLKQCYRPVILLIGLCLFFVEGTSFAPPVFSQTHYTLTMFLRCTRDQPILNAFSIMQSSDEGETSLERIVSKPARVIFKDMETLNKGLKNYDALSWISSSGEQVIFVNKKHQNAPPEALAALISHEAIHDDIYNSLEEEVQGWSKEAKVWTDLKSRTPFLSEIPPGAFPLVDRENRIEKEYRQGTLEQFVRNNAGYRGLPETSPGYGDLSSEQ